MNNEQDLKQIITSVIDEEIKELQHLLHDVTKLHDEQTRAIDRLHEKMTCVLEAIRMHRLMEEK
jgi:hypothetical protein